MNKETAEYEQPNLPLTRAASAELIRRIMAKHPDASPIFIHDDTHVEVDPWIFVPLLMAEEDQSPVIFEVHAELIRRHPKADPAKLLNRILRKLTRKVPKHLLLV